MRAEGVQGVGCRGVGCRGGEAQRHSDWKSCEARVKGVSGAKFKKCASEEEEAAVLTSWGLKKL